MSADYRQAKPERQKLLDYGNHAESDFTLLEELDILTVNIRGLSAQFVASANIEREDFAEQLRNAQSITVKFSGIAL
ncbi:MAG: hypothetical protein DCF25_19095 [Leptolyngbya foveolarum]|uniref:Uncharacterized protein n=1 Tax=Leptolyngbya foveolarum TaxID=47253 RepID=A0A2W4VPN5_9CYAN|nr:MAG: hypothetical protein DCF25_19095 [Leptolyngbya foveolarum]